MKKFSKVFLVLLAIFLVLGVSNLSLAASAVNLGTAGNFAVLGGSTITNTGSTVVNGDLGLSPGTSVTGFPPGMVNGTQHVTDGAAAQAQIDLVTAYNSASGQTVTTTVSGDLGGLTLTPGVYNSASSLGLTGALILDGQGNPDAVFIFQIGSALTTASGSTVSLINGAQACNIFWQVSSSVTLGTNSTFVGTILALTSITATTGASINGRVLARNGAVTLDIDSITKPTCAPPIIPPAITPATLHVIKRVINNNSGTATASLFNLHVKLSGTDVSGSPAVGIVTPGRSYTLSAGTYNVSEDSNTLYTQNFSGDCDSSGNVTLLSGDNKICTITNDDVAPGVVLPATIRVVKIVVNDSGRTRTVSSFPLFVGGTQVTSGVVSTFPAPAAYTITETIDSNYTQTFSGDCSNNSNIDLLPGDNKTCTITNNDIGMVSDITAISTPSLPNTGLYSEEKNISWQILAGVVVLASILFYIIRKKQMKNNS